MLCEKLQTAGFIIKQTIEDADTFIVNTAIDASKDYDSIVIVGEDVDLLVILTALASSKHNIYFMKPSKGKIDQRIYSSTSFQYPDIADHILFLHAFIGCDTTSTFFRQGKIKFIKLFRKNDNLQNITKIFGDPYAHPDFIDIAGQKCILALYRAKSNCFLDEFRFSCFVKSSSKVMFNLASIPPTEAAARPSKSTIRFSCGAELKKILKIGAGNIPKMVYFQFLQ